MQENIHYTLVNYAIASDGGSIALCFNDTKNKEFWVSLDKGIDSKTKGRIFSSLHGDEPLTTDKEKELVSLLKTTHISVVGDDGSGKELVNEVLSVINQR